MKTSGLGEGMGNFAMLSLDPDGHLLRALREGLIQPRDLAIFLTVLVTSDWRTGRCWLSIASLADASGRSWHTTQQSLGRLRKAGLVARGADKRDRAIFWCINPTVAISGGKRRRLCLAEQFFDALA